MGADAWSQRKDLHRGWAGCLAWSGRIPPPACGAGIGLIGGSALLQGWSWVSPSSSSIDPASKSRKGVVGVILQDIPGDLSTTPANQKLKCSLLTTVRTYFDSLEQFIPNEPDICVVICKASLEERKIFVFAVLMRKKKKCMFLQSPMSTLSVYTPIESNVQTLSVYAPTGPKVQTLSVYAPIGSNVQTLSVWVWKIAQRSQKSLTNDFQIVPLWIKCRVCILKVK